MLKNSKLCCFIRTDLMMWLTVVAVYSLLAGELLRVDAATSVFPERNKRADDYDLSATRARPADSDEPDSVEDYYNLSKRDVINQEAITGRDLGYQKAALDTINYFREDHGSPALTLDSELSKTAQEWADNLASEGIFPQPSCNRRTCKYGESISVLSFDGDSAEEVSAAVRRAVQAWYAQGRNYDFRRQGLGSEAGNDFTQLIWKATRKFGIGIAQNTDSEKLYVVAQFSPPGNRRGLFAANVQPN